MPERERSATSAQFAEILRRFERIERWLEAHDKVHDEWSMQVEKRLTKVEERVQSRTLLGVIGLLVSTVAGIVGLPTPPIK